MARRTLNRQEVAYFFSVPKEERDSNWENKLVTRLKSLVKQVAKISFNGYDGSNRDILDLEDFESMAYIGLLNAIREYDSSKNDRFHNFVLTCMQNEIRHGLIEKRGRKKYLIVSLKEVDLTTDGGIEEAFNLACWSGTAEYIFARFEGLLGEKEYIVLSKLFESGCDKRSEVEVAAELGTTRANVQHHKKKALGTIRRCLSTTQWDY